VLSSWPNAAYLSIGVQRRKSDSELELDDASRFMRGTAGIATGARGVAGTHRVARVRRGSPAGLSARRLGLRRLSLRSSDRRAFIALSHRDSGPQRLRRIDGNREASDRLSPAGGR